MQRSTIHPMGWLFLSALLMCAAPGASAVTVLTIGDSIAKGKGSFGTGGYRQSLDERLDADFQFIGRRRDENHGDHSDWQFQNGYPGDQAATNTNPSNSILRRLQNDNIIERIGRPDVILLHVGTHSIGYADPVTASKNPSSQEDQADWQLYRLLDYLGTLCPTSKIIPKVSSIDYLETPSAATSGTRRASAASRAC